MKTVKGGNMLNYRRIPAYNPSNLVDSILQIMGFKNDAELARAIRYEPSRVYKLRSKGENLTNAWLIDFHDLTGYSAEKLREMAGIQYEVYEKMKEEQDKRL
jgi:hypothetical protein